MKKAKSMLAMLLCVVLLTGVAGAPAFAAQTDRYKNIPYTTYTYIGDSIAWGYGLDREMDPTSAANVCGRVDGAYGDLVGKYIEQKNDGTTHAAATSGARLSDYRMLIEAGMGKDDPYTFTDWYAENRAPKRSEKLQAMSGDICSWLRESDLVSIQLGYNDLLAAPMFTLQDSGMVDDMLELLESEGAADDSMQDIVATDAQLTAAMKDFLGKVAKLMLDGVNSFRTNTRALIKDINEITGKKADIVLVGYYNPYRELRENANNDFKPLLDTMSVVIATMNDYFSEVADMYDNVYYVDAPEVSVFFPKGMLYTEAKADGEFMLYGAHPDEEGHAYVADRILSTLNYVNSCGIFGHDSLIKSAIVFPDNTLKTIAKVLASIPVKIFTAIFPWLSVR